MDFYDINLKSDITAEGAPDVGTAVSPIGTIYANTHHVLSAITAAAGTPDVGTNGNPFGTMYANTYHVLSGITAGAGTPDLGTVGSPFGTLYGEATSALWGDLAEKYKVKESCEPGTVMCVSKDAEFDVELCDTDLCTSVIGVISTKPGYTMGNQLEEGQYVALTGQVPVKIVGPINKSDFIVPAGSGCARAGTPDEIAYKIGVANGSDDDVGIKLVDCIIK